MTRYIVVRNGVELEQMFTVKKEAEAYDKMLEAAENLSRFIKESKLDIDLDEKTIDTLSVFLAKNGPEVTKILKGVKPIAPPPKSTHKKTADKPTPVKEQNRAVKSKPKRSGK
ncbi:MAG: YebG family protein [Deltaproteobacteria bacterium]|nr:YebG family protein [Deltaproteobacteria bacterium]